MSHIVTQTIEINLDIFIYLFLILLCIFILIKYKKELDMENLLNYFIYLTNKSLIFFILLIFIFSFIFEIGHLHNDNLYIFLTENFKIMLYFGSINYSIFFLLKFVLYYIEVIKTADLFSLSFYKNKNKLFNGGKHK